MRVDGREQDPQEVEEALKVLIKAEEIKKHPELLKAVSELAESQKDAITSIADLKKAYEKAVKEDDKHEEMPRKAGVKKPKEEDSKLEDSTQDKEIEKRVKSAE
jgi:hypothetical protein